MKLKLIVARARNGVIGIENRLPWHLPEDLAWFKQNTLGCPVLMGRKTYESINRPLPGRLNVILSSQANWQPQPAKDGTPRSLVRYPDTLGQASNTQLALVHHLSEACQWLTMFDSVFLIGGSQLYKQALDQNLVDEMLITEINQDFKGDAFFPEFDSTQFRETERIHNAATEERAWTFDFVRYIKNQTIKE